jgi:predicted ester cyclase
VSSEAEENKAIVRRFLEELAKGNLDVIDEVLSPVFVDRGLLPGQGPTREDFKRSVAEILGAFSITSFTIDEQVAEGDTVVTKYTERSVIRGEFAGLPPTGTQENFQAPLCQADAREGRPESATSAPYTASETRLLRQRIASLLDLPSASFLRWYAPPRGSLRAWQTAIMCMRPG